MSFSKSQRKVSATITPAKIKGERRTNSEIETTVVTTLHSAWTPKKGGALNSQLFDERKILIGHWFENWTDVQRRQFLEHLVEKFNKMSVHFVHNMLKDKIPVVSADFTQALPQYLSLRILSYLDPRTLAQASLVSWHWKWLCEHDVVWKPKCLRRGWDYGKPEPPYERAVWKRFYQQQVWDLLHPPPPSTNLLEGNTEEDGGLNISGESGASRRSSTGAGGNRKKSVGKGPGNNKSKSYKLGETTPVNVGYLKHKETELPPWRSSDNKPKDIQLFNKAILGINSESVPRQFSDKFQKIEISRSPQSPRCNSPHPARRSTSKEKIMTPLQSKSMVMERKTSAPNINILKSNSSGNMPGNNTVTPTKRHVNPNKSKNDKKVKAKRLTQSGPIRSKHTGLSNKTMANAATKRSQQQVIKKVASNSSMGEGEGITVPTAWGRQARKVASTDTLGSDAALEIESNDSLYGDDSGKLAGEAWELHSNLSDER